VNRLAGQPFVFASAALKSLKGKNDYKSDALTSFRSTNQVFHPTAILNYGLHVTLLLRITSKQWGNIGSFRKRRRQPKRWISMIASAVALNPIASCFCWLNTSR
jgi:hypothetical protein